MSLDYIAAEDPQVADAIGQELSRQRSTIELIASENIASPAVMQAMGTVLTNKYAEGYSGKRYYGGCEKVDIVEDLAIERACKLFGCKYANVQPHSGANANLAAYQALINLGDTVLGLSLDHGGHLTHGSPVNFSGKNYNIVPYGVNVITNCAAMGEGMVEGGLRLVSGGTDNHLVLVDLTPADITGKEAEKLLERVGLTVNKNTIPNETRSPFVTSGIRVGTAAGTTRGFDAEEFKRIGQLIAAAVFNAENEERLSAIAEEVKSLIDKHPLYPEL